MDQLQKLTLQVAKEIVVKFIETGRISPANFADHFEPIYNDIYRTITKDAGGRPSDKDEHVDA